MRLNHLYERNMKIDTYLKKFIIILGVLASFPTFAWYFDGYISGGVTMARLINQEKVWVFDDLENRYVSQRKTNTRGMWGGAGAMRTPLSSMSHFDVSIGLAGYEIDYGTVKGIIFPYANLGDFDPLLYAFKANSTLGLIEGRLFYTGADWQPYLLAGVGGANNHLHHYRETPLGTAVSGQLFTQAHHHDTAVEVGFGLKHKLFQDTTGKLFSIALDYRYFNTGSGHLGPFIGQTTRGRLHIDHLETDALLLSLNVTA